MKKSKVHMPKELKKECSIVIHTATSAAAAAGAIPIPISDAIPIMAAQVGMVVKLGKIFELTISEAAAKSITGLGIAQQAGRAVVSNTLKAIPGAGTLIGGAVGAATAAAITETFGWLVANDFFRIYNGEEPENIVEAADSLKGAFDGLRISK